jgi:hypothetical protein
MWVEFREAILSPLGRDDFEFSRTFNRILNKQNYENDKTDLSTRARPGRRPCHDGLQTQTRWRHATAGAKSDGRRTN